MTQNLLFWASDICTFSKLLQQFGCPAWVKTTALNKPDMAGKYAQSAHVRYLNTQIQGDEITTEVTRNHAGSMPSLFPSSEMFFPAFLSDESLLLSRAQLRAHAGLSGHCILSLPWQSHLFHSCRSSTHIIHSQPTSSPGSDPDF